MKRLVSTVPYGVDAFFHRRMPTRVICLESGKSIGQLPQTETCIRGAGTGYAGAAVPLGNESVVSTLRLNGIGNVNRQDRSVYVESGAVVGEIKDLVWREGFYYPPDPASFKACTIGGNAATNAGGPRCYLHGVTSNFVDTLDVVLPSTDQTMQIGCHSTYSAPYDIRDLFIGSNGTLGLFTGMELRLKTAHPHTYTYILSFETYARAIEFIQVARQMGIMTAAMDMSTDPYIPQTQVNKGAKLLISLEGGSGYIKNTQIKVEALARSLGAAIDGSDSDNLMTQRARMVKENVSRTIETSQKPCYFLFDAIVPQSQLETMLGFCYELADRLNLPLMNTFHAGDGNIHPTLFYDPSSGTDLEKIRVFWYSVLRMVVSRGGAISGEHGVGLEKRDFFSVYEDPTIIRVHAKVKSFFDPKGRLAPNKVYTLSGAAERSMRSHDALVRTYQLPRPYEKAMVCAEREVVEIPVNETLHEAQSRLRREGVSIPYEPVAFKGMPTGYLFMNGVPSTTSYLFRPSDILIGGSIQTTTQRLEIGRKVLKNVSGYSLRLLLHRPDLVGGRLASLYVKTFPIQDQNCALYAHIPVDTRTMEQTRALLNKLGSLVVDAVVHKSEAGVRTVIVLYNDSEHLATTLDVLKNGHFEFSIDDMPAFPSLDAKRLHIVSMVANDLLRNEKGFIYLVGQKTYVTDTLDVSWDTTSVESVRELDENGSRYIFVSPTLERQLDLEARLIDHLMSESAPHIDEPTIEPVEDLVIPLNLSHLETDLAQEAIKCSQCGLCLSSCPHFKDTLDETRSPRGIISMIRSGLDKNPFVRKFLAECSNLCRSGPACQNICPTGVDFSKVIAAFKIKN